MESIRQDVSADALPDFRNLGVTARILIGANGALLAAAWYAAPADPFDHFLASATLVEPMLLANVVVLYAISPVLARLPYAAGCAAVFAVELALAGGLHAALAIAGGVASSLARSLAFSALGTACFFAYFRLFARAWSPALAEARLPPLENAIYHGVEPSTGTGEVRVAVALDGDCVRARVSNPVVGTAAPRRGNHMALDNIRERLLLFFDAEARLEVSVSGGRYEVRLDMPYRIAVPSRRAEGAQ